jgi:Subtilase family
MLPRSSVKRRSQMRPPLARPQASKAPNQDGVAADNAHVSPWQGKVWLRRMAASVGALIALSASTPAALAEESPMPTTQATAYNADWVPYLDPPEKPAAVCLVDSGVNITPDTPPDSPEGPIVKRLALDGGTGVAANSTWEGLHGTRMAFVGAAPVNDWGAVGFWPGARIISIRAMPVDQTTFPFDYYSRALVLCTKQAGELNIAAVNLSLGCDCEPTPDERARLQIQITSAHNNGESVVAAAGNSAGPVSSPAREPGVLAVAAADMTGALCPFSNRGDRVDSVAPGCSIDLADPATGELWYAYDSGTSGASIATSALLALLRSYRPDLDWQAAEALIRNSSRASEGGPVIDVEALFRVANLGSLVDIAKARAPAAPSPVEEPASALAGPVNGRPGGTSERADSWPAAPSSARMRLPSPQIRKVVRRRGHLVISVRSLPRGAHLSAALRIRRGDFGYKTVARGGRSAPTVSLRLPRRWRGGSLVLRFEPPNRSLRASLDVYRQVQR